MRSLIVDNYTVSVPIIDILYEIKANLTNGKLRDIRQRGKDIVVTCPHHNNGHEANPDCNIYVGDDTNIPFGYARCFACDFHGQFTRFVAECFDSSEEYAKDWLIKKFGTLAYKKISIGDNIILSKSKSPYLDESILNTYQTWCPYLAKRKLSRSICEQFNVRYDSYRREVIFPAYDIKNRLVMLPKRSIDTKMFYLDKNVEKPVYCLNYIVNNNINQCIITEGPIDTLTAYTYGKPAIGTLGTISDHQIDCINKSCIKVLYLMFDNDEAGRRFTETLKSKLDKRILTVEITFPEHRKDINELSKEEFDNIFIKYPNFQ